MTPRRLRLSVLTATVALLATTACGLPSGGAPTDIAKSDVPFHLESPATSTTLGQTAPSVGVGETIFLVVGGQHLQPVTREVQVPATLPQVLGALLDGPTAAEAASGIQTFLTSARTQVTTSVAGGIATVDFATNPVPLVGADQTLAVAQLVFTVTQQPGIAGVSFQIAGQPIEVPTATGVQVPGPVSRTLYASLAPVA